MKEQPELKISEVETSSLVPYIHNANVHSNLQIEQIANSIEEFGFCDPVGVWENANGELEIVEGHGRVLAAKKLGLDKIPVIYLNALSDEQRRAYTHIHNQLTRNSEFDFDVLQKELDSLDFDFESLGFDLSDFSFEESTISDVEEVEIPETVTCRVKPGEVWMLGAHRVMCGSAESPEDFEKLTGGGRSMIDLWLTDPPYGVSYVGKTEEALTIQNDSISKTGLYSLVKNAASLAKEQLKPGAAFYMFHADSTGEVFRNAVIDAGLIIRECLVWVKNSMVLGRQDYQWRHEPCLYGWNDGGSHKWYSDRKQTTVLEFDRPSRNGEHPTMKPIPLIAYLIGNSTKRGDKVLDSFGGSGSTLMACEQLGRECYTMELDPHYCDVIIQRWEDFTGEKAVKVA